MTYQIYPIKVGSIFYYRGGFTSNPEEYKEKEEFPILIPGHTPGLQGVLADTENGVLLIASDTVPLYECIQGLEEGEYGISSLCVDLNAFYKTFDRLRNLQKKGVRIIASHDFKTLLPSKKFY